MKSSSIEMCGESVWTWLAKEVICYTGMLAMRRSMWLRPQTRRNKLQHQSSVQNSALLTSTSQHKSSVQNYSLVLVSTRQHQSWVQKSAIKQRPPKHCRQARSAALLVICLGKDKFVILNMSGGYKCTHGGNIIFSWAFSWWMYPWMLWPCGKATTKRTQKKELGVLHNSTKIPHIKNPLTEVFSFHLSVSFNAWLLSTIRIKIYVVQAQVALAALLSMV